MKQKTHAIFWLHRIRYLSEDVCFDSDKSWLKPAVISHCRSYAKLTGRSEESIIEAVDLFFIEKQGELA